MPYSLGTCRFSNSVRNSDDKSLKSTASITQISQGTINKFVTTDYREV